jgi:AraC-like DNA-binding protein
VYAPRESLRVIIRRAFPRRRTRLACARTSTDFARAFRRDLVDAAIVDLDHATADTWRAVALAGAFPSVAFYGYASYRGVDGPTIARCIHEDFVDVFANGVDEFALRELVIRGAFSTRFTAALAEPPQTLCLETVLQRQAWALLVSSATRGVRTDTLARQLGVSREHLSRKFASGGAPNLKRAIDLVRLLAAAELAKNPGYDIGEIATILRFASPSHLASTARRVGGTKPLSLARLRAIDLVARFAQGRARSRAPGRRVEDDRRAREKAARIG